jgi:hypothetical protein
MEDIKLMVPTYDPDGAVEWDYEHQAKLTLHEAEGFRIVMGERAIDPRPTCRSSVRAFGQQVSRQFSSGGSSFIPTVVIHSARSRSVRATVRGSRTRPAG